MLRHGSDLTLTLGDLAGHCDPQPDGLGGRQAIDGPLTPVLPAVRLVGLVGLGVHLRCFSKPRPHSKDEHNH